MGGLMELSSHATIRLLHLIQEGYNVSVISRFEMAPLMKPSLFLMERAKRKDLLHAT